jgi:hypothetical protein
VCARSLFQAHTTALERVEQQSNLAKQKAEDATNQAQEGLREAKTSKLLAQVPFPFSCPRASSCKADECLENEALKRVSIYLSVGMYPSISLTIYLSHKKQGANSTATGLETEVKNIKTNFEEAKTLAEGIAKGSSQDGEEIKRIARESHVLASSLQTTMQDLLQDVAEITTLRADIQVVLYDPSSFTDYA